MKRSDSGFRERSLPTSLHDIGGRSSPPSRRRNPKQPTMNNLDTVSPAAMETQRPPMHRRSKTSSGSYGSKRPSSRTSCTIIDPSRSRHYRMQSSQTIPIATRQDIDDVYALHHRSYNMFRNPSLHTASGLPSPSLSQAEHFGFPCASPRSSADEASAFDQEVIPKQRDEIIELSTKPATAMHWTSPYTRRREYERIDRANSGFRGLINRVMPRCVSGPQEKFYEKDQSDAGSVRRYRIEDDETNEKSRARSESRAAGKRTAAKKRWLCF